MLPAMRPLLAACALVAACSHTEHTSDFLADGRYGVGVHTFTFVDTTRPTPANGSFGGAPSRTLVVEVWYPAAVNMGGAVSDAAPAHGPFPLVLHSHGFHDGRGGESYLGEHLASHGFIVAAPDFPLSNGGAPGGPTIADTPSQPGDVSFVLTQLLAQSADASSPLANLIDGSRIGASGLSLGGLTTLLLAFHPTMRDSRIKAALTLAAPSCMMLPSFFAGPTLPLLLVHGDADEIVPVAANSERIFPSTPAGTELVLLANGSHTGFAGVAALFDQSMNLDRFGCQSVVGSTDVTSFSGLGTPAMGISADTTVCPMPCTAPFVDPSLDASRQQDLSKAIVLAFFDAHLTGDAQAGEFLRTRVVENMEVHTQTR